MADIMDVDVADLDTAAPMVELGLSSLHVVDLTGQLTESLEIEVPATLIYECVTVEGLCAHLDNSIEDAFSMITPNSGVVPAGPVGALPPSPAGVEDFSGQATTATTTMTTMLKSLSSSMRAARIEAVWHYRTLYRTSTLQFWQSEHRRLLCGIVHKSEAIKMGLQTLPVEVVFKIRSYLHLDDLKE